MGENKTTLRLTIIAVLLAMLFGILQYIPKGTKYEVFTVEGVLFVLSQTLFPTALFIFFIYTIIVAFRAGYDRSLENSLKLKKFEAFSYDLGMTVTFISLLIATGLALLANIINIFPIFFTRHLILGGLLLIAPLVTGILAIFYLMSKSFDLYFPKNKSK